MSTNIYTLFTKEVHSFFNSLIAYIVVVVFLTAIGLFFWIFPGNTLDMGFASLDVLFIFGPYVFLFLIPAITMRSFAEEKKSGTIEFLSTRPVTDGEIILGKYFAAVALIVFSLLPSLIYYYSISHLSIAPGIDRGATWGAYIGLILVGSSFAALGIFSSSVTDNQIVAFILGFFLCFIFYKGLDFTSGLMKTGTLALVLQNTGISAHYESISRGVVDTRDVLYFISFTAIALMITKLIIGKRNW